jgi:hypothetical protein
VFSQTTLDKLDKEIDTLSISVIMPNSIIEDRNAFRMYIVCGQHNTKVEYQEAPLGQFDLINKPREFWFFWNLVTVRD